LKIEQTLKDLKTDYYLLTPSSEIEAEVWLRLKAEIKREEENCKDNPFPLS